MANMSWSVCDKGLYKGLQRMAATPLRCAFNGRLQGALVPLVGLLAAGVGRATRPAGVQGGLSSYLTSASAVKLLDKATPRRSPQRRKPLTRVCADAHTSV